MRVVRSGAWLASWVSMLAFATLWSAPVSAEDQCISAAAEKAVACDANKLTPKARRGGVSYKPPAVTAPGKKQLGPADPEHVTKNRPRVDRALEKKGRQYLMREIASVSKLYRDTPKNSKEKPQLLRRLADNYAELEADLFREQIEAQALSSDVRRKNPSRAQQLAKKADEIGERVNKARKEAIRHYRRLADKHPKFCQFPDHTSVDERGCTDQTLYYLAYEYELAREAEEARNIYLKIVTDWPQSKYVPHAYLAFGELYFSEAQGDPSRWALAQQAYDKVIAFPAPANKVWGYANYKLAYVHWNQGAHGLALDHFQKVIEFGTKHASVPNAKSLMRAARRDLIPVYAMTGQANKAYTFFKPLSGDATGSSAETFSMMEDLGQALMDTGHFAEAKVLYGDLMKRNGGAKSCTYQARISEATIAIAGGDKAPIINVLDDQLSEYLNNRDGGYDDRAQLACANHTASLLAETAMAWHLEAVGSGGVRGTGDSATMDKSAKLYAMVDDNFSREQFARFRFPQLVKEDWPSLASLRYLQADLLWERKRWKECGRAFYRAYEADPQGEKAGDALFATGQCWQNAVLSAKGEADYRATQGELTRAADHYKPQPIGDDEKQMLAAFDAYACRIVPPQNDDDALEKHCEVKFARARVYYEARHYEEAAAAFRDIALNHASCEASVFAANLYLESMEVMRTKWKRANCVDGMSTDAPQLDLLHCKTDQQRSDNADQCLFIGRTNRDLARLGIERDIDKVKRGDADAAKKLGAAGDKYWKMWEDHGKVACAKNGDATDVSEACKGYDEILHNAAAAYDGAHLLAKAMTVRQVLISPKYQLRTTPVGQRAVYNLGANYQAIAVYDLAAQYYERFATENPKLDDAPVALSDAVVLRLGLGDSEQALADAASFTKIYGKRQPQEAAQIAFAIGAHHVERGAWREADKALSSALSQIEEHATPDIRVQTHALLGRVYDHLEQRSKADALYGKARAAAPKLAELKKIIDGIEEPEGRRTRRYGKLVTAVGEALNYFASKERDKAESYVFPTYKGGGTQADVDRFVKTQVLDWLTKKKPAIERATAEYMKVIALNDTNPPPRWAIAAGAAVGNMWGSLVDDFITAPYPKEWDQPGYVPGVDPPLLWAELKAIYKTELMKKVAPYQKVAKDAYVDCLEYGLLYQHFDGEVRSCETWLSKTYPLEFHLVDEIASTATRIGSGLSERPLPLNVNGTPQKRRRTPPKKR